MSINSIDGPYQVDSEDLWTFLEENNYDLKQKESNRTLQTEIIVKGEIEFSNDFIQEMYLFRLTFLDTLYIENASFLESVIFHHCKWKGDIVISDTFFNKDLSFLYCTFCSAYNIAGLNVDGILNLTGNNFSEDYNLERISVKERITSSRCRIAGMNVGKFPIEEYLVWI